MSRRVALAGGALIVAMLAMGSALVTIQVTHAEDEAPALADLPGRLAPQLDDCDGLTTAQEEEIYACFGEIYAGALGDRTDAATRIPAIERVVDGAGGNAAVACHTSMHAVGRTYARRHSLTLSTLRDHLPRDDSMNCSAGFAHGILTELGPQVIQMDPAAVRHTCYASGTRLQRLGCIHGLGHAYLRLSPDVPTALSRCARLGTRDDLDCAQGVFHDYWFATRSLDESTPSVVTARTPSDLCAPLPARYVEGCFFRAAPEITNPPPLDNAGDLSAACDGFRGAVRRGCITSLAQHIRPAANRPAQLRICAALPRDDEAQSCLHGLTVSYHVTRRGTAAERAYIRACTAMRPSLQAECVGYVAQHLQAATRRDIATSVCPALPAHLRPPCREGVARRDAVLSTFA